MFKHTLNQSQHIEEISVPATDRELLILSDKLLKFEIPTKVFLQALDIATYDCASAFRYADNYLNLLKIKNKRKNLLRGCFKSRSELKIMQAVKP